MLEAAQYEDNAFVTLTYSEETLPEDLSVRPAIVSAFVKRLRKYTGHKFRYFACGEYGDQTGRPHYHLALFGFPTCFHGRTRHHLASCCTACESIKKAWLYGRIEAGLLTPHSMAYVAGYLNKKMTRDDDPRLEGRRPEFARMSLRPAIGSGMLHEVASTLMEHGLDEMEDVPVFLDHGKQRYPLGRTMRRKLRQLIGRSPNTPEATLKKWSATLQPLREAAFANSVSLKSKVLEKSAQRRLQMAVRGKIFAKGKTL